MKSITLRSYFLLDVLNAFKMEIKVGFNLKCKSYDEEKTNKHDDRIRHPAYDDGHATHSIKKVRLTQPDFLLLSLLRITPALLHQEELYLQSIPEAHLHQ